MGWIKNRIDAEFRKHKNSQWSLFAEAKIKATIKSKLEIKNRLRKSELKTLFHKPACACGNCQIPMLYTDKEILEILEGKDMKGGDRDGK